MRHGTSAGRGPLAAGRVVLAATLLLLLNALRSGPARALEVVGKPVPGGTGFQPAGTELARDLQWLDGMLMWIIVPVVLLVVALLAICILRYNRRANPVPARFTHHSPLEITWTVVPVLILLVVMVFSLPILFKQQVIPDGDVHIRATGYQWYWGYEYTDAQAAGLSYEGFMLPQEDLASFGFNDDEYLLATDTALVVPVGKTVVMTVTGADVIHSWSVPAFGVKQDAVPGRFAQLWFRPEREGIYFGQCSELCGKDHAYMPITVMVVDQETYDAWMTACREAGGFVPLKDLPAV